MSNKSEGCLGKSFWTGIGAIAALIVAIISIPQAAPLRQGISQTFSGTPAATEPPTATPSPTATPGLTPTPTPQVVPINQTMNCTNCSSPGFYNLSLKVKNATIDPAKGQVTLLIEVDNIASTSQTDNFFTYLKLQDLQTAATKDGGGDGFSGFDVAANASHLVSPTFQFIPVVGHGYSLTASMSVYYIFSPITIKFG